LYHCIPPHVVETPPAYNTGAKAPCVETPVAMATQRSSIPQHVAETPPAYITGAKAPCVETPVAVATQRCSIPPHVVETPPTYSTGAKAPCVETPVLRSSPRRLTFGDFNAPPAASASSTTTHTGRLRKKRTVYDADSGTFKEPTEVPETL
jgi:hypothetical protein